MKRIFFAILAVPVLFLLLVSASPQGVTKSIPLDALKNQKPRNVKVENAEHKGRKALRVTDDAPATADDGDRLLILTAADFSDGIIELELSGQVMPNAGETARGFVGIAFRVANDAAKFECFYLRPTNGRAEDQVRRNHSTQYISFPDFPWQKLRKEFPEKYESYVDLVPGDWTKVKIEVRGTKARLFVHGVSQPVLIVNDLKLGESKGTIGLWVGPGTVAHFSDLQITQ
ncbi:MAG: hypothetical protein KA368_02800 [Acidobacteria bacterium]|nr:hypothetical protein [Acidobacteriota bacterium]